MGVSNDACMFYGFAVGEDETLPEWMGDFEDFDDWAIEAMGLDIPADDYSARRKAAETCPAELFMHCSYDYPMYVLGVRGAEHRSSRGELTEITAETLAVDPKKVAAFRAFCEKHGIEYEEPKWLMGSMNG